MRLVYRGRQSPFLVVADRDTGREYYTDEDGEVDVPDKLGNSLLDQPIWEEVEAFPSRTSINKEKD